MTDLRQVQPLPLTLLVSPGSTASSSATPLFTGNILMRQRPLTGHKSGKSMRTYGRFEEQGLINFLIGFFYHLARLPKHLGVSYGERGITALTVLPRRTAHDPLEGCAEGTL